MDPPVFTIRQLSDQVPLVATAVHHGHWVRRDVGALLAIDPRSRRREEDPWSGAWTRAGAVRVVAQRSRFEVDLNRPRERAVYLRPEDAWGLHVWKSPPSQSLLARSLAEWDSFYGAMAGLLDDLGRRLGPFVVLDLHTYNHRRTGPHSAPEASTTSPDVNIGTGTMDRRRWAPVVEGFMRSLRQGAAFSAPLDVRENVRFQGGYFPEWVHRSFPTQGCAIAVEVKKFFMDEWSGRVNLRLLRAIGRSLADAGQVAVGALREGQG